MSAAVPVVFADLYKGPKDFFSKGFPASSFRTEYKVKGSDGYLLTAVEQTNNGTVTTTAEYEQTCAKCTTYGTTTGKIVLNAGTGRFQPSLKLKDFLNVKGLTVGVNADQPTSTEKAGAADKIEPFAELFNSTHFSKVAFNLNNNSIEASSTVSLSKILLGGSAKFGLAGGLSTYTGGLSYKTSLLGLFGTFTQVLKDKSYTATVGSLYQYKPNFILGGQAVNTGKGTTFLLGAQKACGGTTYSLKANNKALLSGSIQHKVGRVVATIGGDFDVSKAAVGNVGVKFLFEE
jgi:hypothetical protein